MDTSCTCIHVLDDRFNLPLSQHVAVLGPSASKSGPLHGAHQAVRHLLSELRVDAMAAVLEEEGAHLVARQLLQQLDGLLGWDQDVLHAADDEHGETRLGDGLEPLVRDVVRLHGQALAQQRLVARRLVAVRQRQIVPLQHAAHVLVADGPVEEVRRVVERHGVPDDSRVRGREDGAQQWDHRPHVGDVPASSAHEQGQRCHPLGGHARQLDGDHATHAGTKAIQDTDVRYDIVVSQGVCTSPDAHDVRRLPTEMVQQTERVFRHLAGCVSSERCVGAAHSTVVEGQDGQVPTLLLGVPFLHEHVDDRAPQLLQLQEAHDQHQPLRR
ncbi:unnamed protein product [Phytophthora fragariaefolia]|uniref:Unnamed protein product n=1 Tax=Phytophthora fragariaefolia TaxID=1490495 RepID=A0A9W6XUU8_9STRA|nr:unnamed protein product [Phytophthora fragariaefolia]